MSAQVLVIVADGHGAPKPALSVEISALALSLTADIAGLSDVNQRAF